MKFKRKKIAFTFSENSTLVGGKEIKCIDKLIQEETTEGITIRKWYNSLVERKLKLSEILIRNRSGKDLFRILYDEANNSKVEVMGILKKVKLS